jgi:uncharacterized protein YqfB (UPF0267 family)
MPRYKLVNGERIQLTTEEEAQRDQEEADWKAGEFDREITILRYERNKKLAQTDFYALADVTMSEAMQTYRQELRDITNGLDTVEKVKNKLELQDGNLINFPVKPSE